MLQTDDESVTYTWGQVDERTEDGVPFHNQSDWIGRPFFLDPAEDEAWT